VALGPLSLSSTMLTRVLINEGRWIEVDDGVDDGVGDGLSIWWWKGARGEEILFLFQETRDYERR
jgi:hypothetical protein